MLNQSHCVNIFYTVLSTVCKLNDTHSNIRGKINIPCDLHTCIYSPSCFSGGAAQSSIKCINATNLTEEFKCQVCKGTWACRLLMQTKRWSSVNSSVPYVIGRYLCICEISSMLLIFNDQKLATTTKQLGDHKTSCGC